MESVGYTVAVFIALFLYLLPGLLGASKRNSGAIWALNILLGWSLIGWVVALVWALSKDAPKPTVIVQQSPAPALPTDSEQFRHLKQLRDEGVLTQDEFMEQVARIR